jgi:hypothetical protein
LTLAEFLEGEGIAYWLTVQEEPRPLRWHQLRVDLQHPGIEVVASLAPDPDGDGPAEAELTSPLALAAQVDALAFVNTNAFGGLPDADGNRPMDWHLGMPVEIIGLAAHDGAIRSDATPEAYAPFWIDRRHTPHIGNPSDPQDVLEGVAGFGWILRDGKILPSPDTVRHPRTAVGLDESGRWLYLLVVDGRQPDYSEGVSTRELAAHMKRIGCHAALNLDGGGSSIMILTHANGFRSIVNDPSKKVLGRSVPRPLPAGLAVRRR